MRRDHQQGLPVSDTWHALLLDALTGIPDVRAGDSVWWHCDMIHSVARVQNQKGWGNVMYIPAAPWCPRNERYAAAVREAVVTGASPSDFPAENYERDWPSRFQPGDLNQTGRRGLGLD
ncbi:MAG: YbiU family protein [Streptosporangiaceae bacterium]